jgi:hypothetical protein
VIEENPGQNGQQEAGGDPNPVSPVPSVPAVGPATEPTEDSADNQKPSQWLRFKWWMKKEKTFTDWCVAAFTFVLAAAAIYQFIVMNGQLYQLEVSNEMGRITMKSVQRAFVTFSTKVEMATTVENGKVISWSPEIPITNSGDTEAKGLLERANIYVSEKEMPKDFAFPDTGEPQQGVLVPRDSVPYEAPGIPITAIQSIQKGGHVYVYGWAKYWDVFQVVGKPRPDWPEMKKHITKFCYELSLNSTNGDVTSPKYNPPSRMKLCPLHNCTDEDCKP